MKEQDNILARSSEGRFWWNRLMVVVLAGLIGFFVDQSKPVHEQFLAKTTLQIDPIELGIGAHTAEGGLQNGQLAHMKTLVDTISTTRLMREVILKHGLIDVEKFAGKHAGKEDVDRLSRSLARMVKSRLREGTFLVDVSFQHSDRDFTRDLVNWVADELVVTYTKRAIQDDERALDVLRDELVKGQLHLKQTELALIEFRKSSNLLVTPEERRARLRDRIGNLHSELEALAKLIASIESDINLIASFGDSPTLDQLDAVPSIYNSDEVAVVRKLLQERERAAVLGGEDSDGGDEYLERLESYLKEAIQDAQSRMGFEYSRLKSQERRVQEMTNSFEKQLLNLSGKMIEYRVLEGQVEEALDSYLSVAKRIREIESGIGLKDEAIWIVEEANWSSNISPRHWALSTSSVVFGLVIGIAAVLLFDNRRNFGAPFVV